MITRNIFTKTLGLIAILGTITLSGCIKSKVIVRVKPDGSGNIIVSQIFSANIVKMVDTQMKAMKTQMGSMGGGMTMSVPDDPFYNEKQLKTAAGNFGANVKFVKAKRYDKAGAKGAIALYKFDDINNIFINLDNINPGMEGASTMMTSGDDDGDEPEIKIAERSDNAVEFKFTKGKTAKLEIISPAVEMPDAEDNDSNETTGTKSETASDSPIKMDSPAGTAGMNPEMQMMMGGGNPFGFTGNETETEIMQKMFKGMQISLEVEVIGKNVKSTASYPSSRKKNRYIIYDMNMDKILASEKGRNMIDPESMMGMDSDNPFDSMVGIPGMTIETNQNVIISFTAAPTK